jgi:hypothetical protein
VPVLSGELAELAIKTTTATNSLETFRLRAHAPLGLSCDGFLRSRYRRVAPHYLLRDKHNHAADKPR